MNDDKLNRFKCDNCNRLLKAEKNKSFSCTSCGHGSMRVTKPKAHCSECGGGIYDNVDLRPDKRSKDGYFVICGTCTTALAQGVGTTEV